MPTSQHAMIKFKQRSYVLGRQLVASEASLGRSLEQLHDYVYGVCFSSTFQLPFRCGMKAEASALGVDIITDEDYPSVPSLS